MGILIAHPGAGPFVRATVEALDAANLLQCFATTLADDPHSRMQRVGRAVLPMVGRLLARRPLPKVDRSRVATAPGGEMLRSATAMILRDDVMTDRVWDWMSQRFDRWAATQVRSTTAAVYGYEYNSLAMFERAQAAGLPRILEVPCAEFGQVMDLTMDEVARVPGTDSAYLARMRQLRGVRTLRLRREFALATCVIANSGHTVDSYRKAGLRTDHFVVVPLGAPAPAGNAVMRSPAEGPLRLLWAGTFGVRKGAHVLIQALSRGPIEQLLPIKVFGSVAIPRAMLREVGPMLEFAGAISQAQLFEQFAHADALLLPSLSDGWGMVVSEALAHGLPVIATTAVGAASLIADGVNGRVIEPGNVEALRETLHWAVQHRAQLRVMGPAARAAAARRTWADYRHDIARVVAEHLGTS